MTKKASTPGEKAFALRSEARKLEESGYADRIEMCPNCETSGPIGEKFGVILRKTKKKGTILAHPGWCKQCRSNYRRKTDKISAPKAFTQNMRRALVEHVALRLKYDELWHAVNTLVAVEQKGA